MSESKASTVEFEDDKSSTEINPSEINTEPEEYAR